ncbi:SCO family protein [Thiohalorhabdus sp. Cl-TMA]|uniref:SCO family protein n=1 Tax=Thiohalorhabdus methylotrophus TaxID=3242694 RepID=A0ABV4TR36_9GAMM
MTLFGALVLLNLGALLVAGKLPLHGKKGVTAPFLERARGDLALVFFGFPGCSRSCPLTLHRLSDAYPRLRDHYPGLEVFFVNLQPVPDSERTHAYIRAHDPRFKGVAPAEDALARLSREFGAWLYRMGEGSEPFHNPYVYVLGRGDRGWRIRARIPAGERVIAGIRRALPPPRAG